MGTCPYTDVFSVLPHPNGVTDARRGEVEKVPELAKHNPVGVLGNGLRGVLDRPWGLDGHAPGKGEGGLGRSLSRETDNGSGRSVGDDGSPRST